MTLDAWRSEGQKIGLTTAQLAGVQSILEDSDQWRRSEELRRFFAAVRALGFEPYVKFDPSIVRGLMYYTGIVFEAWEVGGDIRRALLGGGRYDNLLTEVGGARLPAVGFAMGDVVMMLLLEKYGLLPTNLKIHPAAVLLTLFDADSYEATFQLARDLRRDGLSVAVYPQPDRLPRQFKYADKVQARLALVLGPEELRSHQVTVKELGSGQQRTVPREMVADVCRQALEDAPSR
jgi:histidyl-tRNA synthetase